VTLCLIYSDEISFGLVSQVTSNRGAKFWLSVLPDLQNRTEVKKIYLSFMLIKIKGFFDAINAAYSNAKIQLCIVHMICNSLKFYLEGLQGNDD
jgi:transposase-like protein